MIALNVAKKMGMNECINMIGRDFVMMHKNNAAACYENISDDIIGASLYVSDKEPPKGKLILSNSEFEYFAEVSVNLKDGTIKRIGCRLPN